MILCPLKDTWASAWEPARPGTVFAVCRVSPQVRVFTNQTRSSTRHWSLGGKQRGCTSFEAYAHCSFISYPLFMLASYGSDTENFSCSLFLVSVRALNISKASLLMVCSWARNPKPGFFCLLLFRRMLTAEGSFMGVFC